MATTIVMRRATGDFGRRFAVHKVDDELADELVTKGDAAILRRTAGAAPPAYRPKKPARKAKVSRKESPPADEPASEPDNAPDED
jgi:hypothetical protein